MPSLAVRRTDATTEGGRNRPVADFRRPPAGGLAGGALWRGPLVWVTSTRFAPHRQDPLPLALADRQPFLAAGRIANGPAPRCRRSSRPVGAIASRTPRPRRSARMRRSWRVWQSPSRPCPGCRTGCVRCVPRRVCPKLPEFGILMLKGKRPHQPVTDALAAHIEESFARTSTTRWRRNSRLRLFPSAQVSGTASPRTSIPLASFAAYDLW